MFDHFMVRFPNYKTKFLSCNTYFLVRNNSAAAAGGGGGSISNIL